MLSHQLIVFSRKLGFLLAQFRKPGFQAFQLLVGLADLLIQLFFMMRTGITAVCMQLLDLLIEFVDCLLR